MKNVIYQDSIDVGEVNKIIQINPDVLKQKNAATLLHDVVKDDKITLMGPLIRGGADINAKDSDNRTPLYYAVKDYREGDVRVDILLKGGAKVSQEEINEAKYENIKKLLMDKMEQQDKKK